MVVFLTTLGCQPQKTPSQLTDDLKVTPADFESLIATARKNGFFKDPATEYDNDCPPEQNFFSFIDKLNAELPGMPAGGRSQPRLALIEGDWQRIEGILSDKDNLLVLFTNAPKLRPGFRSRSADPLLDFGRTVRSKGALELLLASAELEASRGDDAKAITQMKQAIAFTNAMADQPAPTDYVSGRGAQVTVLVSINRIASRLREMPERLDPYAELVENWTPKLDRERLVRFEVNSFLKKLFAETEQGVYQAALDLWRIKRNASSGSSGDRPYTSEEEAFVEAVTRESMKEKQALPYSPDALKSEHSAIAVVVGKVVTAGLERLTESPNLEPRTDSNSAPAEAKTLSDLFHGYTVGTALDGPEDLFFTHKALVLTAIELYREHRKSGFPKSLPSGGTAPKDALGRPIELVKLPAGLSLRSVGPDGQPDPDARRKDDRVIRLDYDLRKAN